MSTSEMICLVTANRISQLPAAEAFSVTIHILLVLPRPEGKRDHKEKSFLLYHNPRVLKQRGRGHSIQVP